MYMFVHFRNLKSVHLRNLKSIKIREGKPKIIGELSNRHINHGDGIVFHNNGS